MHTKKIRFLVISLVLITLGLALDGFSKPSDRTQTEQLEDWQVRLELARVLSYQKKYDESIKEYQEVLKAHPDDAEIQLELATIYAYKGDRQTAAALLKEIKIGDDPEAKKKMANIFAILKDYSGAETYFKEYLKDNPDDLQARVKYADMLSWEKRYNDSLAEYRRVLEQVPDDIHVRRKYALVLIWMGKPDEAAVELKQTLQLENEKKHPEKG